MERVSFGVVAGPTKAMQSLAPISFHAANKTGIRRTKSHAAQRWMAVVVIVLTVQLALTQQVRP